VANHFLTVIAWIGTVLVALVVGRFAASDPRWDSFLVWAGIAGVVCVCVYAVVWWRDHAAREPSPADRSRLPAATLIAGVGLAAAIAMLAGSYGPRWDVTANRVYQLSGDTREVLRRLDAPVRILLFVEDADRAVYRDLLDEYAAASRLVSVEPVDVEAEPALARQYDVQEYGTSVVEYKGRFELIRGAREQDFTNALARLREGRTRKIYFTTGHAERDIASTERVGYSGIIAALRRDNFVVETINFTEQSDVPSDATLAVVAGPRADFFSAEIDALRRYRAKGGAMLFLIDPFEDLKRYITESGLALFMMDPSSVSGSGELRNVTAFIRGAGAELGNDVVVDTSEMGQFIGTDASVPVAASYPPHPITQGLTALSAYPMARSVKPVPADATTASAFIETSDRTWSETDIQQLGAGRLSLDPEDGDRPGPVSLGVAVEAPPRSPQAGQAPARQLRMVAVGDSDFAANYSANIPGNAEMFLSIVRWLAQEKVATIPPRLPQERVLTMTAWQHRLLSWIALLLLPGIAVGTAAYLRKRRLEATEASEGTG
jgi:ABC-type uncharacterized transport system involved in gliding motility auxiliary subunit